MRKKGVFLENERNMNKLEKYINDFKNYEIPKTMKATVLSGIGFENVVIKEVLMNLVALKSFRLLRKYLTLMSS